MLSLVSRLLLGVGLALVLLACSVDAHAWLSNPKPRGQYLSPPKTPADEYKPASHSPNDPNFVCRGDPASPKASWVPMRAGQSQSITISFTALHVGDCFVYLTYDGDKPASEQKWFKIWEQHSCKDKSKYDIPIPSYLPSGEHVVFRWEWYALHLYSLSTDSAVEYFASCFDATITGAASGVLPLPQVNIPGHLPVLSGSYAAGNNNYWWPWDSQPMFFTGPRLATVGGQSAITPPPAEAVTKSPTYKPTEAATVPPTVSPTVAATVAPTVAPTVAATVAPTAKPTVAPTAAATAKPTTGESVKLYVMEASSTWWLSVSPTGPRTNEITKISFTDQGGYKSPATLSHDGSSGSSVYTFSPAQELKYPLLVTASLASGSSITFAVNYKATLVNSNAVFP